MAERVVVGLGCPTAGDDAVGQLVIDALGEVPGVRLVAARDTSQLLTALEGAREVVIVDASTDVEPGQVRAVSLEQIARGTRAASSHGFGLSEAIALLGALHALPERLTLLGVGVDGGFTVGNAPSAAARRGALLAAEEIRDLLATRG